jgi:acyl transferase domain-containing protein/acyl carrier protein
VDTNTALGEIAVVAMTGRMPGAPDLQAFWSNLANGVESRTALSDEQLAETIRKFHGDPAALERNNYVKAAYLLDRVEWFDHTFFGLSSREAELIDPQHRLFLECAWEVLELAGYPPGPYCPRTGVFAGCSLSQYLLANLYLHVDLWKASHPLQNLIANDKDYLTTRTSYLLDLKGPSVAVQSACSTSLVAICLACDSLRDYQCDLALAGGVTVMVPQKSGYWYEEGNIYSPDGHCRPFDARAAGTVFGSGVGVVALKRLEDALTDGDHIISVIRDTAVNNDGGTKISYTAPNEEAQAEVIATAHARAGVPADSITYIETHGTGTQLGDPIEVAALTRAFRRGTQRKDFCGIGSVKSNVGHLQAAAGIASFIKAALSIQHRVLPPSVNFERPNPAIDFANSPFYVNAELSPWPANGTPRRAGVSSFGMGGTNAHLILEEPPEAASIPRTGRGQYILPLSAKSESALRELARRYEAVLERDPERLPDICFTAAAGRAHFKYRFAAVGGDSRSLARQLAELRRCPGTSAPSEWHATLLRLAAQYERGEMIDWSVLGPGRRLPLPTYPFERQRCWVDPPAKVSTRPRSTAHPLLGPPLRVAESESLRFECSDLPEYLLDHVVAGRAVVPGSACWEMALAAARGLPASPDTILDSVLYEPLVADGRPIQTILERMPDGGFTFRIYSFERTWRKHAEGRLANGSVAPEKIDVAELKSSFAGQLPGSEFYRTLRERGSEFGPAFQTVAELWAGDPAVLSRIRMAEEVQPESNPYRFHPALLDGCLQTAGAALREPLVSGSLRVPAGLARLSVTGPIGGELWIHARCDQSGRRIATVDVYEPSGRRVAELRDIRFATIRADSWNRASNGDCYEIAWRPKALNGAAETADGQWLMVLDRDETGRQLAALLEADGGHCIQVAPDNLDLIGANDFEHILKDGPAGLRGVVYLAELDVTEEPNDYHATNACVGLMHLVQALTRADVKGVRLWVVTRETQPAGASAVGCPGAAPLWSLASVVAHEHPEFGCCAIDLGPGPSGMESLAAELRQNDGEDQIAYRRGVRYVARLTGLAQGERQRPAAPFRLTQRQSGSLDSLTLVPANRRPPEAHEVEVEVHAAGLNFKDVLVSLGQFQPTSLGSECTGVVCSAGEAVKHMKAGDAVLVAMAPGCMASHVTVPAQCVVPLPEGMSFIDGATLPIAVFTARHALIDLAGLRAGERILIHAAAGGVGLAAVQMARKRGAEVFATASPPKWKFLETIGVEHVLNSRTIDFATEILRLTGGRGVDVVLNSLSGQFVDKSFEVLSPGGRFVELGKLDTWDRERVRRERPDVSYFQFDIGEEISGNPALMPDLLEYVRSAFPLPRHVFPVEDAASAFRFMAQGKHVGKVVLSVSGGEALEVRSGATYLIAGGMGALGRLVARRLIEHGASHIILAGRHAAEEGLEDLRRTGARVAAVQADISLKEDVTAIATVLETGWPPLRGIVHAAGVLDDGILLQQTAKRFAAVLAPKVAGAWNLHEFSLRHRLDFFICFSSASSVLGTPGQGSYAAANAFLDALAHYRRSRGLPALTINWGPWAGEGMAARHADRERLAALGIQSIGAAEGLEMMERLSRCGRAQAMALPANWDTFGKVAGWTPLLDELVHRKGANTGDAAFLKQLSAVPPDERAELLDGYLRDQAARILGLPSGESVDRNRRLFDLGLDSLAALELRNLLELGLGSPLRATLLFDCGTIAELQAFLMRQVLASHFAQPAAVKKAEPIFGERAAGTEPIAIIGMGCRLPGNVRTPADYWALLCNGVDAIAEVPPYRWNIDDVYDSDPSAPDKTYSRSGGFLGPVEDFDAEFFGMSAREAATLDPQQRLLLETSWEAFEHAHLPADRVFGSDTGVFVGISMLDNATNLRNFADPAKTDAYYGTGNSLSGAAGRLSYLFGLKGPCMAVETACSSSLVAIHLARRSLLTRECGMAVAAGVNLILSPEASVVFSRARMLSTDGRCKTFSDAADGYGRGEGCGVIILERLSDALKNRRRIIAVIRGTAVNQDGASGGLTVPNGPAQQAVIQRALAAGGVDPALVDYVEAHGTGTALGDPIEVNALGAVFAHRPPGSSLMIGTAKSNIGHLESAAGVAGVIKVALCVQNGRIPPSLHFDRPNRNIPWGELPVRVVTALESWPAGRRRLAGVSSFGFAGTNAHAVIEEPPAGQEEAADSQLSCRLLTLSAKTEAALRDLAGAYEGLLATPDADFADLCRGANTGRTHFKHRMAVVAASPTEASRVVAEFHAGHLAPGLTAGKAASSTKIAFLFTGQGAQYRGMGRELYRTQPVFRAAMDRCAEILGSLLEEPLLDVVWGGEETGTLLDQTAYTQPALFALEYALVRLWESWGIHPAAVLGDGIGDYAAACAAGVFSVQDGLELVAARSHSRLMDRTLDEFRRVAARVRFSAPRLPLISNDTGEPAGKNIASADYWLEHLLRTVNFGAGLEYLLRKGYRIFVEIGPQPLLLAMSRSQASAEGRLFLPSLSRGRDDIQQMFSSLASLYTAGAQVDWEAFELGKTRPHTVLPSYPFQRVRHWYFDETDLPRRRTLNLARRANPVIGLLERGAAGELASLLEESPALAGVDRATVERVLGCLADRCNGNATANDTYRLEWRPAEPIAPPQIRHAPDSWLIFADAGGVGRALTAELRGQGHSCTLCYADGARGPEGSKEYTIDAHSHAELAEVLAHGARDRVVYLWDLNDRPAGATSLLNVVKALAGSGGPKSKLWVVTRGAIETGDGSAAIDPEQAPSWGLGRVIGLEHPESWGGSIDLDPQSRPEASARTVAEICTMPPMADQFVLRGGKTLLPRLVRCAPTDSPAVRIKADATYLISGGLGGLGLGVAKWMASQGARSLILVGRSGLTDRTRERIAELEKMGVRVTACAADVASESDVKRVFAEAPPLPPIRGIVHAAGVLDDGILLQQDADRFERVMTPKVRGAWNLHSLSEGMELDFFVLFSSIAALLGSPGQGNYAAANAYLDALAAYRRARGLPGLSINWGPWGEVGMAASLGAAFRDRLASRGVRLLTPAQGFATFGRLLGSPMSQVAVMDVDWAVFKRQFPEGTAPPILAGLLDAAPPSQQRERRLQYLEELKAAPADEWAARLTAYLQERLAEVLGTTKLPATDLGFAEMGLDSLMTLELKSRLEADLGMTLSPAVVFNYPTIEALAGYLHSALGFVDPELQVAEVSTPNAEELAALDEIRNTSDDELAAMIAREYEATQ